MARWRGGLRRSSVQDPPAESGSRQGARVAHPNGQRAHKALELQVFELASACLVAFTLDTFQTIQEHHVRRVDGKRKDRGSATGGSRADEGVRPTFVTK